MRIVSFVFCLKNIKNLANIIDTNNDGEVSREELEKAYEVLRKAREQDQLTNKINMLSNISEKLSFINYNIYI
jgi:hypothetical protein